MLDFGNDNNAGGRNDLGDTQYHCDYFLMNFKNVLKILPFYI